jgi:hypothetical protein
VQPVCKRGTPQPPADGLPNPILSVAWDARPGTRCVGFPQTIHPFVTKWPEPLHHRNSATRSCVAVDDRTTLPQTEETKRWNSRPN